VDSGIGFDTNKRVVQWRRGHAAALVVNTSSLGKQKGDESSFAQCVFPSSGSEQTASKSQMERKCCFSAQPLFHIVAMNSEADEASE
jgi:hypothetical protein